jgi:hypothetical protein
VSTGQRLAGWRDHTQHLHNYTPPAGVASLCHACPPMEYVTFSHHRQVTYYMELTMIIGVDSYNIHLHVSKCPMWKRDYSLQHTQITRRVAALSVYFGLGGGTADVKAKPPKDAPA